MESPPVAPNPDPESFPDADWDTRERHETPTQRLDRNWVDLLQELRVVQTGVQLLTGFLLTLPFQQRFTELDGFAHAVYLVTASCSVAATGFLIGPVALHRALFRQHARRRMVATGHVLALVGMALLAASVTGVMLLIFDALAGRTVGLVAGGCALLLLVLLWLVLPLATRFALEGPRGMPEADPARVGEDPTGDRGTPPV